MIRRHISMELALYALTVGLIVGCEQAPRSERWTGAYSYPNNSLTFPLYLDLTVKGEHVSGRAFDGNMEEAAISGTVNGAQYSLLLHPLKQGASSAQDIYYRGKRAEDGIVGEWEHVVGVKGRWTATTTELGPKEALKLHASPCEPSSITQKADRAACGKDA
jgi:hypothetical protein